MIVALSSSSPSVSVALIAPGVGLLASVKEDGLTQNASALLLDMLDGLLRQTELELANATMFAADLGPGSFIGVRVCVTIAKSLAFAQGTKAAGASAFDLIDPGRTVVIPSKKGEYFVRELGKEAYRTAEPSVPESVGYGKIFENERYPEAAGFERLVSLLEPMAPEELLPRYLIEPSISLPKRQYGPAQP